MLGHVRPIGWSTLRCICACQTAPKARLRILLGGFDDRHKQWRHGVIRQHYPDSPLNDEAVRRQREVYSWGVRHETNRKHRDCTFRGG
jgi:hypothetical protein